MDKARILVVEDDKDMPHLVASRDEDYEVDVVHDGANGLDAALTGACDLIVLDLMLPSLRGLELSLCPASRLTGEAEGAIQPATLRSRAIS